MKSRLPTLIFAEENEVGTFLPDVLLKLTPELAKLGYDAFYDENASNATLLQVIQSYEKSIQVTAQAVQLLEKIDKEIITPTCEQYIFTWSDVLRRQLYEVLKKQEGTDYYFIVATLVGNFEINDSEITTKAIISMLKENASLEKIIEYKKHLCKDDVVKCINDLKMQSLSIVSNVNFRVQLSKHNVSYQAIDDAVLCAELAKLWSLTSENELVKLTDNLTECKNLAKLDSNMLKLDLRDSKMVATYLSATKSVFSVAGLRHLESMQKIILEQQSLVAARSAFDFIYIFREPSTSPFYQKLPEIQSVRQGKTPLPLGVTLIDAINKTQDEVAQLVLNVIKAKMLAARSTATLGVGKPSLQSDYKIGSPRLFVTPANSASVGNSSIYDSKLGVGKRIPG